MRGQKSAHILAVDPSLTQSGWALFSLKEQRPIAWGLIKGESTSIPLGERLLVLHKKVQELFLTCSLSKGDYVVCEGPAPVSLNPSSSIKVEQVRGIFEGIARSNGVEVPGRLNPRTIQSELLGLKGRQIPRDEVKRIARTVVNQLFPVCPVKGSIEGQARDFSKISQDAIDAILVGVLARAKVSHALTSGVPLSLMFEGGGSASPAGRSGRRMRWSASQIKAR
ncbi:MAG TPA: hypothetical protein PKA63_08625 [Oligoflexia bacterium]|nr:hypothetical protein [Oligoflexia bacterium]HMP48715.1 hypothetical protein [Oligoflexia bacterium]